MKVLSIMSAHDEGHKMGGPIKSIKSIHKSLNVNNIDVNVVSTNMGLDSNQQYKIIYNKWIDKKLYKIKYFKYYGYDNFTFSPMLFLELLINIKSYDLVLLHGVWNFPTIVGGMLASIYKVPYILSPRGALNSESFKIKSNSFKKIYYKLVVEKVLKKVSALHFTTKDEKERVNKFLGLHTNYIIVPNSINLDEFYQLPVKGNFKLKHSKLNKRNYILFLGRISKVKGLDILIDSFFKIAKRYSDWDLVIAGPDNERYKQVLIEKIDSYNINERIIFTGMLNKKEKLEAIIDAEIFVLPSYSENFGNSAVEAMACGTPTIISNKVGIYKEVLENEAALIVDTTVDSLTESLDKLISNIKLRNILKKKSIEFVKKFYSESEVSSKLIQEYKRVINEK